ncbi:unnamed protein product, partial [Ectocarpus fasciculatus]
PTTHPCQRSHSRVVPQATSLAPLQHPGVRDNRNNTYTPPPHGTPKTRHNTTKQLTVLLAVGNAKSLDASNGDNTRTYRARKNNTQGYLVKPKDCCRWRQRED